MDLLLLARALHVLAIVHWIGGVAMVTLVVLPGVSRLPRERRFETFQAVEQRFARQARLSVLVAGLTGAWMAQGYGFWDRFRDLHYWWMHAMVLLWTLFAFVLFIAEPLFLHARLAARAAADPDASIAAMLRAHRILLTLAAVTVAGAVMGAHGFPF